MSAFAERLATATGLGQSAHDCLQRIEDTLSDILDAVKNDEIHETVRQGQRQVAAGVTDLAVVPQGETWELAIASVDPDVAGQVRILADGKLRVAFAAAAEGSSSGDAVQFLEGQVVQIELVTATVAAVFLQFNVKVTRPLQAIP